MTPSDPDRPAPRRRCCWCGPLPRVSAGALIRVNGGGFQKSAALVRRTRAPDAPNAQAQRRAVSRRTPPRLRKSSASPDANFKVGRILWNSISIGWTRVGPLGSVAVRTSGLAQLAMTEMYSVAVHPANLKWVGKCSGVNVTSRILLTTDLGKHVLPKEARQVLFGLFRPLTGLHRTQSMKVSFPKARHANS